jgi:hypothetical protein
VVFEEDRA